MYSPLRWDRTWPQVGVCVVVHGVSSGNGCDRSGVGGDVVVLAGCCPACRSPRSPSENV